MRFLHLADVHLDTPFPGRTATIRRRLQEASHTALARALDLARREAADAVLIAGDLFDGSHLSFSTERFLLEQMQTLDQSGIQVVYATGNHDSPGSHGRAARLEWPPNVTLAAGLPPVRVAIRGRGADTVGHVTAAGHATPRESRDLSRSFPSAAGDGPEVALLHTQVEAARQGELHGRYAPSSLEHLRGLGYDYWALGHIHQRQVLSSAPMVCYPGNPQGRSFNETGPRGCLLVDLGGAEGPVVQFHATSVVRFETLQVRDLASHATLDHLLDHVESRWAAERVADPLGSDTEWIVRVELDGPTPLARLLAHSEERETLGDELAARLGALDVDVWSHGTHPVVSIEEHAGRQDALGEALRLLGRLRAGHVDILDIAPEDLAGFETGGVEEKRDYLLGLLDGASGEIIARMRADVPEGEAE